MIEATLEAARSRFVPGGDVVLDGPPGASCPVASVVRAADVCLLVTEPTPFGLHGRARTLVEMRDALRELAPELVLFAGDDRRLHRERLVEFLRQLRFPGRALHVGVLDDVTLRSPIGNPLCK